jgi:hypothetical protein
VRIGATSFADKSKRHSEFTGAGQRELSYVLDMERRDSNSESGNHSGSIFPTVADFDGQSRISILEVRHGRFVAGQSSKRLLPPEECGIGHEDGSRI